MPDRPTQTSAKLVFPCPHCGKRFRQPADRAGRRAKCAACGEAFLLEPARPKTKAKTPRKSPTAKPAPAAERPAEEEPGSSDGFDLDGFHDDGESPPPAPSPVKRRRRRKPAPAAAPSAPAPPPRAGRRAARRSKGKASHRFNPLLLGAAALLLCGLLAGGAAMLWPSGGATVAEAGGTTLAANDPDGADRPNPDGSRPAGGPTADDPPADDPPADDPPAEPATATGRPEPPASRPAAADPATDPRPSPPPAPRPAAPPAAAGLPEPDEVVPGFVAPGPPLEGSGTWRVTVRISRVFDDATRGRLRGAIRQSGADLVAEDWDAATLVIQFDGAGDDLRRHLAAIEAAGPAVFGTAAEKVGG